MESILSQHFQKYLFLFCDCTVFHGVHVSRSNPFVNVGAVRLLPLLLLLILHWLPCTGLCAYKYTLERSKLRTSCGCCRSVAHRVRLFATPQTAARQASLSITISQSLPKFTSIASVIPSSHLTLWHSFSSALNLSQHQGLFQLVSYPHQVTKILELQLPSNEYPGLISLKIDWFDLLAVQRTLRSLLQHHS